jgi:hypothetical protein
MNYSRNHKTALRTGAALLGLIAVNVTLPSSFAQDLELIDKASTFQSQTKVETTQKSTSPEFLPRLSAKEEAILKALQNNTEVAFRDNDLTSALEHLKEMHEIEIWIDANRLDIGNLTVTLEISDIPLRSCLNLMLKPLDLTYFVEDDVLKVTSQEIAAARFITRTYPAGDLFSSSEEATELTNLLETGLGLQQTLGVPNPLSLSMKSRVIVLRQSHQMHEQLLRTLRETNTNERIAKMVPFPFEITLDIGFERDAQGTKLGNEPRVFYNDQYSPIEKVSLEKNAFPSRRLLICADGDVPSGSMRQLIEKCRAAGFTNIMLKAVEQ